MFLLPLPWSCVGFGPGAESQAHAPNEITWKDDLVRCAALYSAVPGLSRPPQRPGRAPEPPEAGERSEAEYLEDAAARHQMRFVPDLDQALDREGGAWKSDGELVCRLPLAWLRKHVVVPVRDAEGCLALAVARPAGWLLAREIGLLLGERPCVPLLAAENAIQNSAKTPWKTCWKTAERLPSSGW